MKHLQSKKVVIGLACHVWSIAVCVGVVYPDDAQPLDIQRGRVRVTAHGIPPSHADAIAKALDGMANFYVDSLALDLPETTQLNAHLDATTPPALWIGDDMIELRLQWPRHLERPQRGRVDVLYGLGYRLAELAVGRTLGEAPWLTEPAQRGLAHYLSCLALERLYVLHGKSLWPDEYDYQKRGMGELKERMDRRNETKIIRACAAWNEWVQSFGGTELGALLRNWNNAAPDALRPKDALQFATERGTKDAYVRSKRKRWFRSFADHFIDSYVRNASEISAKRRGRLMRDLRVLKHDDDTPADGVLLTRGAHIITFKPPPDKWYLTEVQFFAERYGKALFKAKDFTITLRDNKFKKICSWDKPYGLIRGRDPGWYKIRVDPVPVGEAFALTIEFESRRNAGIRLFKDASSKGNSASGSARRGIQPLADADWMIRAVLDRAKDDNPLIWKP